MNKSTYSQKLLDPRWQKLRLEKLASTEFSCEICGASDKTMHVHHKQYFKGHEVWEYSLHELASLCSDCHSSEHDFDEKFKKLISLLNIDGPGNKEDAYWLLAGFIGAGIEPESLAHKNLYFIGNNASEGYWRASNGQN